MSICFASHVSEIFNLKSLSPQNSFPKLLSQQFSPKTCHSQPPKNISPKNSLPKILSQKFKDVSLASFVSMCVSLVLMNERNYSYFKTLPPNILVWIPICVVGCSCCCDITFCHIFEEAKELERHPSMFGSMTLSMFCDKEHPHLSYPKLKGKAAEVKTFLRPLLTI